jgi:hypothetical protein
MAVDQSLVYEMWELARPLLPPRSRLYHLEPIGIGTPYVESLTSYVARLAKAHGTHPKKLVMQEIWPLLKAPSEFQGYTVNEYYTLNTSWIKNSVVLNGVTSLTGKWVQVIEQLTRRRDLCFLTMLTWANVLTSLELLRNYRAWCPACYEEWRQTERTVYEPLMWSLKVVTVCPRHRQPLRSMCSHEDCRQSTSLLAQKTRPGYCAKCERWLGTQAGPGQEEINTLAEDDLEWRIWIADAAGELLAAAPGLPAAPEREDIARSISTCIERITGGSINKLAHRLKLSYVTIRDWKWQVQMMKLGTLPEVCYCLGIPPSSFLSGKVLATVDPDSISLRMPRKVRPKPRKPFKRLDIDHMRRTLEEVLVGDEEPPPSVREVGRRLGYDHSYLRKYFPELCRAISAQYKNYRRDRREERLQRICDEIREATFNIHAQGFYPSSYRVMSMNVKQKVTHMTA